MIVRPMEDERLLAIPQPTHALMAAQFCRYWGNERFPSPQPGGPVLLAIAQHDSGWIEWERAPRLRDDGYPMDFIHYTDQSEKTHLWQRGIDRVFAQHPYAALLVSRHASRLYNGFLAQDAYAPSDEKEVTRFLADQQKLDERVRKLLGSIPVYQRALEPDVLDFNTRLLQFGDRASLQVSIPWAERSTPISVQLDGEGEVDIEMRIAQDTIIFDPWPYSCDSFDVQMEGFVLNQREFQSIEAYHGALANAPYYQRRWTVQPATRYARETTQ